MGFRWAVVLSVAATLAGCTLGHQKFKPTTAPLGDFRKCRDFTQIFNREAGAERVELKEEVTGLTKRALISNVCLGDEREGKRMSLAVIEFDDEGSHWDGGQLENALAEVRRISEHMITAQTAEDVSGRSPTKTEGVFLVVYVHGWRSNASEARETLSRFRWFVSELAKRDETCFRPEPRFGKDAADARDGGGCEIRPHVLGVYVSWRGDAVGETLRRVPGAEYLTFWNRRAAARRVAGTAMTETLLGLFDSLETWDRERFDDWERKVEARRKAAAERREGSAKSGDPGDVDRESASEPVAGRPPQRSRSLVIGHSMGALILEQAFAQAFLAKRVEARRLYGRRLQGVLADVQEQSDSLQKSKNRLASFGQQLETATQRLEEHRRSIADVEAQVADLDKRLKEIDVSEADWERLKAYADMTRPQDDGAATACTGYSAARVRECTGGSHDLRIVSDCVAREVACIYDSHRCSVGLLISKAPGSSRTPDCRLEISLLGDVPAEEATKNEIKYWEKFEEDLDDTGSALSALLADRWDGVPVSRNRGRQKEEILQDEGLFDGGVELRNTMLRWLDKMRPRFFAPVSVIPPRDVTENDEERLLKTLLTAREDIAGRLDDAEAHLTAVQEDWLELREERNLQAGKNALEEEIRSIEKKRELARREEVRLRGLIAIESGERHRLADAIAKLAEKVPFELDGALHPPGDVVLLLNAATEAMSSRNLIQAMCRTQGESLQILGPLREDLPGLDLDGLRRPWIVSATSRGDWATKRMFPAGVRLGRAIRRAAHRDVESTGEGCDLELGTFSDLVTRTVGHHEPLFSHDVEMVANEEARRLASERPMQRVAFEAGGASYVLAERTSDLAMREYWVTQVPTSVIRAHGDVLTDQTLALVSGLLAYNSVFVSSCPRYNQNSGKCEGIKAAIHAYRARKNSE